jgi:hypothetical protein
MPFRTPDTLPNERVGQGEQPYRDNREAMTQKDAELQAEAEKYGETHQRESGDEQRERMEHEAEKRFEAVQKRRA